MAISGIRSRPRHRPSRPSHITAATTDFTATIKATVNGTACHPVVNEVQSAGLSAGDEFVELYNPCTVAFDVGGWTLDYRASSTVGSQDTNLLATLSGTMAAGELRLYVGPAFTGSATPDGAAWGGANGLLNASRRTARLGLRSGTKDTGPLVDLAFCYGTLATTGKPVRRGREPRPRSRATTDATARASTAMITNKATKTSVALSSLPTPTATDTNPCGDGAFRDFSARQPAEAEGS